jgi:hypothetical protein
LECRKLLFHIFDTAYTRLYTLEKKDTCRSAIQYILEHNIVHGDALSLKTVGENPQPIIFSEWSLANGSMVKRRDFAFHELVSHGSLRELPLFSDQGEEVFIPNR